MHNNRIRLEQVPVAIFTITMGLCGLAMAMRAGERVYEQPSGVSFVVFLLALLCFSGFVLIYLLKMIRHPTAVQAEWGNPVQLALFPSASMSMLLLASLMHGHWPTVAHLLWLLGAAAQGILTLAVVSGWISARAFQQGQLSPAWLIPAVGNVVVPFAGVPLGYIEISWFFLSASLVFWLVLMTLVINRLIFHDPLPERLQPSLVILIAPPALIFLAWLQLMGEVDAFSRILLNIAYLFVAIVTVQLPRILRLRFTLSAWALSFPMAAAAGASFTYALKTGSFAHEVIGLCFLAALSMIIMSLVLNTVRDLVAGDLFSP